MIVTFKVEGLRALGERFRGLSKKMAAKTAGRTTSAGARVIKKAAIRNIRSSQAVDTALLVSAVIMKRLPKGESGVTSTHIVTVKKKVYTDDNPRGDRNTRRSGVFVEYGVEYGTVNVPARPYLRRALQGGKTEAVEAMVAKLREELDKEKV